MDNTENSTAAWSESSKVKTPHFIDFDKVLNQSSSQGESNKTDLVKSGTEKADSSNLQGLSHLLPEIAIYQQSLSDLAVSGKPVGPVDEQSRTFPGIARSTEQSIGSQPSRELNEPERAPARERTDRVPSRPGRTDTKTEDRLAHLIPEEMKFGASWNAWDRVDSKTAAAVARNIRAVSESLSSRSASITKFEVTDTGAHIKKDALNRVVSIEDSTKNLKMHFNYEGNSTNVTEMVVHNTKTNHTRTLVALYRPQGDSPSGKQEWLGVDSKGRATHMTGDVSVADAGGYKINLKSLAQPRDIIAPVERPVSKKSELEAQTDNLTRTAERLISKPAERQQFLKDMEKYQQAAKARGLPDSEVADFFKESAKLMTSTEDRFVNQQNRIKLVQQALKQAIEPTTIRQGPYNTCNVTTIEVCMYHRNPSKAIKAIAEAALTGSFTTSDGKKIELNRSTFVEKSSSRTFASQIFQDLAANTHWRTATVGPDGETKFKPGEFRYDHDGPKSKPGDGSQRLTGVDSVTGKVTELGRSPRLSAHLYPDIYRKIAGTSPETLVLEHGKTKSASAGLEKMSSEENLHKTLADLSKKPGGFPVILVVHTTNQPFWKDSGEGAAGGAGLKTEEAKKQEKPPGGWHVVTIHGYDAASKLAAVDNTWDPGSDHLGKKGQGEKIKVDVLFKSMERHPERLKELGWVPPPAVAKPPTPKKGH